MKQALIVGLAIIIGFSILAGTYAHINRYKMMEQLHFYHDTWTHTVVRQYSGSSPRILWTMP